MAQLAYFLSLLFCQPICRWKLGSFGYPGRYRGLPGAFREGILGSSWGQGRSESWDGTSMIDGHSKSDATDPKQGWRFYVVEFKVEMKDNDQCLNNVAMTRSSENTTYWVAETFFKFFSCCLPTICLCSRMSHIVANLFKCRFSFLFFSSFLFSNLFGFSILKVYCL